MSSQSIHACSPADLWHHRLNQAAHRLSCVGWLLLIGVAFPAKLPAAIVGGVVLWAAVVAVVCSVLSSLVVRPDDGSRLEAIGVLVFALALLIVAWIMATRLNLQYKPHLVAWLRLELNPEWLRWTARGTAAALALWIGITTAVGRPGRT